ncbi:ABC transporter ATP-binding protein [Metaclostridioides mangenotii]|uniref:ABC transporter ATP-binding protein n=1 Tax=Metaclostridioides mangenotii TaxID=1540 RepID=UPI000485A843|nr:ATP-binding cassette domain-containing protein [Clostridioides mangenotii]
MLEIKNISKTFDNPYGDSNTIFKDLSIDIATGEFVTIIGSNGTGKSTLLNIISGLIKQTSGEIWVGEKNITNAPEHKRTQVISRVFQDPSLGTCPSMTVRECLKYKKDFLSSFLEGVSLDLKKYLDVQVKYLSGGQRQSLALIMSCLTEPSVLLLDEHTAALDPKTSNEVIALTNKIVREKNITTLMVTHNLKHALEYGDRLIMLHKGQIVLDVKQIEKCKLSIEEILNRFEYAV